MYLRFSSLHIVCFTGPQSFRLPVIISMLSSQYVQHHHHRKTGSQTRSPPLKPRVGPLGLFMPFVFLFPCRGDVNTCSLLGHRMTSHQRLVYSTYLRIYPRSLEEAHRILAPQHVTIAPRNFGPLSPLPMMSSPTAAHTLNHQEGIKAMC